ncbi:hypothetical protein QR680_004297 [Steinernema hermaphroditum]|uniref:Uncharacterized protein n=1 Tax=Steinernema hermaphroditum TaxID=289476 RepID=A0AA39LSY9_9BILA|nr:hypothetical protein QR680_004297 [Steinernema hermaphroditum]
MLQAGKLPYIEYVELALDIVAPFVTVYFLFLLRRPVFHLNLRILLAHFSMGLGCMTFLRIFILFDSMMKGRFLDGECAFWVHLLHNGFVLTLLDASVLMAGERFVATILVDRYENLKYWLVTVLMCGAVWFINMYISYFTMIRGQNAVIGPNGELTLEHAHYNTDIICSLVVLTTMNVVGVVVFFVLYNYNRKRWARDRTKNLGQRYQISENMKTSKQLSIVLLANLVINAYLFFVLYYMLAVSKRNRITESLSQFFDIIAAAAAILLPALFITMHPALQDTVRTHLFLNKVATKRSIAPIEINMANVYFNELAKTWQLPEKRPGNVWKRLRSVCMSNMQLLRILLILLLLLVTQVSCRIRFSHLGSHYDGTFGEEVGVSRVGECTLMAFKNKKIGFRIKVNEQKRTCALLTTFKRFTTLNDSNIRDYILTTSISDQVCTVNTAKNVTGFISGQCTPDGWDCKLLETIRDYCIFVGSDKPDCISSVGASVRDVKCRWSQHRVAVRKETLLCCPQGETLLEERNGKAFCCPEKKVLKEVLNDTAICCDSEENSQEGTGPSSHRGCCPSGEEFVKREGGIDYCCPKGRKFQEIKNGKATFCINGYTLKGYHNGLPKCCSADQNYDSASGTCCPKGWFYQRNGNDGQCCSEGSTLQRAPNGKVVCCPPTHPKALVADDGRVDCCEASMTKLEVDPENKFGTGYQCSP